MVSRALSSATLLEVATPSVFPAMFRKLPDSS